MPALLGGARRPARSSLLCTVPLRRRQSGAAMQPQSRLIQGCLGLTRRARGHCGSTGLHQGPYGLLGCPGNRKGRTCARRCRLSPFQSGGCSGLSRPRPRQPGPERLDGGIISCRCAGSGDFPSDRSLYRVQRRRCSAFRFKRCGEVGAFGRNDTTTKSQDMPQRVCRHGQTFSSAPRRALKLSEMWNVSSRPCASNASMRGASTSASSAVASAPVR